MIYEIYVKVGGMDVMCFKTEARDKEEAIQKCKRDHPATYYEKYKRVEQITANQIVGSDKNL